jgi:CBS domain-containing protein
MPFDHAKTNFAHAAQHGLDAKFTWFNNKKISTQKLILKELLPIAEEGLKKAKIDKKDIDKYLGIIRDRVDSGITGAQWMLDAHANLTKKTTGEDALTIITAGILKNQTKNIPVHKWKLPSLKDGVKLDHNTLLVEEFMGRDLFTVQPNDIIALVSEIMDWQKIKYVAVENENGNLVGLVTARLLLKHYKDADNLDSDQPIPVKSMMIKNPITIKPESTIKEAMEKLQKHGIGCLLVVKGRRLVGIITSDNFLAITQRLMNRSAS